MTLIVLPQYKNCHAMDFLFGFSVNSVQIAGFRMPAGTKKHLFVKARLIKKNGNYSGLKINIF